MGTAGEMPLNLVELVEWFEDTVAIGGQSRAVALVSTDAVQRLETLHRFYELVVSHPRFGGAWPATLPSGSLSPTLVARTLAGIPPRAVWIGLSASGEELAEPAQMEHQLSQLRMFPDIAEWVQYAAEREFPAALLGLPVEGVGSLLARGFGVLTAEETNTTRMGIAMRALDEAVRSVHALPDAGVLGIDAPQLEARALIAAGWIQRLAQQTPVVLVIDEAHRAGPFVQHLISYVLQLPSRVLVVLAGEPEEPASGGSHLAGPFRWLVVERVNAFSLPAGNLGSLLALAVGSAQAPVMSVDTLERAARSLGEHDPRGCVQQLIDAGWLRRLTPSTLGLATLRHERTVAGHLAELDPFDPLDLPDIAVSPNDPFDALLAIGAHAASEPSAASAARFALALANTGSHDRAAKSLGASPGPAWHRALIAAWDTVATRGPWDDRDPTPPADDLPQLLGADSDLETLLVRATTLAHTRPELTERLLDAATRRAQDERHWLAIARLRLTLGDIGEVRRILDERFRDLLPSDLDARLKTLSEWSRRPGVVARTVAITESVHLVETLRRAVPGSVAYALGVVAWLERLEHFDRLHLEPDAAAAAQEACEIFAATKQTPPLGLWRAATILAVSLLRRGETDEAHRVLTGLAEEQRSALGGEHHAYTATRLWAARTLLEARRFDDAHAAADDVLHARLRNHLDNDPALLEAHHWHAAVLLAMGRPDAAIDELQNLVDRRTLALAADDELLLASRHLLGSALARVGRQAEALPHLREVAHRRARSEPPQARRMLAAHRSYGACLLSLARYADAAVELDLVLRHGEASGMDPDEIAVTFNDRGVSALLGGQHEDAVGYLREALRRYALRRSDGDERVLVARQQFASALQMTDRPDEAIANLRQLTRDAATVGVNSSHPIVAAAEQQLFHLLAGRR